MAKEIFVEAMKMEA